MEHPHNFFLAYDHVYTGTQNVEHGTRNMLFDEALMDGHGRAEMVRVNHADEKWARHKLHAHDLERLAPTTVRQMLWNFADTPVCPKRYGLISENSFQRDVMFFPPSHVGSQLCYRVE